MKTSRRNLSYPRTFRREQRMELPYQPFNYNCSRKDSPRGKRISKENICIYRYAEDGWRRSPLLKKLLINKTTRARGETAFNSIDYSISIHYLSLSMLKESFTRSIGLLLGDKVHCSRSSTPATTLFE